ncbi:NAD-dependent epimerase/dehydratase family protein [Planotetraspora kaengkrachanensis]|uniref:NAD-dependent epimerase/dehydratase family protein n=1 Tax=Planotetraspora kaengkrachanensis TaxID=575193 RepID=UPI003570E360
MSDRLREPRRRVTCAARRARFADRPVRRPGPGFALSPAPGAAHPESGPARPTCRALHRVSVTDPDALAAVVARVRPRLICHLAAQIDVRASVAGPAADSTSPCPTASTAPLTPCCAWQRLRPAPGPGR